MALNRFAGFRDGSHEAFRFYFNEFQESIFNFALRRTGDKDRAQEITQEAFMKLWMFRERIKDEAHLERFLFVVARNLFLQYEKKDAINYQRDLELSYLFRYGVYSSEDPEAALNEVLQQLQTAINELSPRRKAVVEAYFFQGLGFREIAKQLGISEQTARNHHSASMIILRRRLAL